jgi:hypothetical protein
LDIIEEIKTGKYDFDPDNCDYDEPCASDYLKDAIDIEYAIDSRGKYIGSKIYVALGGPTIWIDTRYGNVEGRWGSSSISFSYDEDPMGIDDHMEELFDCL